MSNADLIVYKGIKFRRYPESRNQSDARYYKPLPAAREQGIQALHQEIWKDANGVDEIPTGFHVHHADHNYLNNEPSNLVLVLAGDHQSHHMSQPERIEQSRESIKLAMEAAKAWHASEEGLAWHREHGKRSWENRQPIELVCEQCGNTYETRDLSGKSRFCSNNCKSAARRKTGVDSVDRECPACGKVRRVNRWSTAKTCSPTCAATLRRRV